MLRCIDDIFCIWTHGEDKLKVFLENLNQFHPNIKFTHESSTESVPFLYLLGHTKGSIVYSQSLRVSRVGSHEADFRKHTTEMKSWFLKRGYPNDVIQKERKKVKFS